MGDRLERAREEIRKLPGEAGWWHQDGQETFLALFDQLTARGLSPNDALALLEQAYGAVAGEFGR